jgi:hypothetical protein
LRERGILAPLGDRKILRASGAGKESIGIYRGEHVGNSQRAGGEVAFMGGGGAVKETATGRSFSGKQHQRLARTGGHQRE